jgi:hypothetical protein
MAADPLGQLGSGLLTAEQPEQDLSWRRSRRRWFGGQLEVKRVSELTFKSKYKGILPRWEPFLSAIVTGPI